MEKKLWGVLTASFIFLASQVNKGTSAGTPTCYSRSPPPKIGESTYAGSIAFKNLKDICRGELPAFSFFLAGLGLLIAVIVIVVLILYFTGGAALLQGKVALPLIYFTIVSIELMLYALEAQFLGVVYGFFAGLVIIGWALYMLYRFNESAGSPLPIIRSSVTEAEIEWKNR